MKHSYFFYRIEYIAISCLLFVSMLAHSVTSAAQEKAFVVKGRLEGWNPKIPVMLYLSAVDYQDDKPYIVDSSLLSGGKFKFSGKINQPFLVHLFLEAQTGDIKLRATYRQSSLSFYVEPGTIELYGKDSILTHLSVSSPSAINREFVELTDSLNYAKQNSISQYYADLIEQNKRTLDSLEKAYNLAVTDIKAHRKDFIKAFMLNHPSSMVSLDVFLSNNYLGAAPDYKELYPVFYALDTSLQNSVRGKQFQEKLKVYQKMDTGKMAWDFTLPDTSGKLIRLSDYKGKYVLIDFWSSTCGGCRVGNKYLVKAYEEYKGKNFEMISISLDEDRFFNGALQTGRSKWLKAIAEDNITWVQLSDLKGYESEVVKEYGIRGIPVGFLVNPEGKIIAKGIGGPFTTDQLGKWLGRK